MILEKIKIQDQMAVIGVKRTAFVIDTNKGILIVLVEFDPVIWLKILKKLQLLFVGHLAPEVPTGWVL